MNPNAGGEFSMKVRIRTEVLRIPPVCDPRVLRNACPIGCETLQNALRALQPLDLTHVQPAPDGDQPVMDSQDCLHTGITTELLSKGQV